MEQLRRDHATHTSARLALAQKRAVENQLSKGCGKTSRQLMMENPDARGYKRDGGAYLKTKPTATQS